MAWRSHETREADELERIREASRLKRHASSRRIQCVFRAHRCRVRLHLFTQMPPDAWNIVLQHMRSEQRLQKAINMICYIRLWRIRHSPLGHFLRGTSRLTTIEMEQLRRVATALVFVQHRIPIISKDVAKEALRIATMWIEHPRCGEEARKTPAHALCEAMFASRRTCIRSVISEWSTEAVS